MTKHSSERPHVRIIGQRAVPRGAQQGLRHSAEGHGPVPVRCPATGDKPGRGQRGDRRSGQARLPHPGLTGNHVDTAAATAGLGEPPAKDRQLAFPANEPLTTPKAHGHIMPDHGSDRDGCATRSCLADVLPQAQ